MDSANEKGSEVASSEPHDATANKAHSVENPQQSTLFDPGGLAAPDDLPAVLGTDVERAYARRAADALGQYLAVHQTGTLEAALAAAGLVPPPGVRLYVVHPLAVRLAMRDGLAELSGGVVRAAAPQANGGRVWVYRRPMAKGGQP
jgi:hypothetical protein